MSNDQSAASIAGTVATVDETIMKFLPEISMIIGFIPGAQPAELAMPIVSEVLMAVDNAAKAVASGNPGAAFQTIAQEIIQHLTPGLPNSPILSPPSP